MEKYAIKIINRLEESSYLDREMHDMHVYVLQKRLEQMAVLLAMYVAAVIFHVIIPTIFFHIEYMSIRKHLGGYHCESYCGCFVASLIMYGILIALNEFVEYIIEAIALLCIVSAIYILITGAVNNDNIHWSSGEMAKTSSIARMLTLVYGIMIIVMYVLDAPSEIILFSMMGIVFPALMLIAEKIRLKVIK